VKWLREIINPIRKADTTVASKLFVFDEQSEAVVLADLLGEIESDPALELIGIDENWDQTGILTKLVTYRRRG
jgi:hypothetical protein